MTWKYYMPHGVWLVTYMSLAVAKMDLLAMRDLLNSSAPSVGQTIDDW